MVKDLADEAVTLELAKAEAQVPTYPRAPSSCSPLPMLLLHVFSLPRHLHPSVSRLLQVQEEAHKQAEMRVVDHLYRQSQSDVTHASDEAG